MRNQDATDAISGYGKELLPKDIYLFLLLYRFSRLWLSQIPGFAIGRRARALHWEHDGRLMSWRNGCRVFRRGAPFAFDARALFVYFVRSPNSSASHLSLGFEGPQNLSGGVRAPSSPRRIAGCLSVSVSVNTSEALHRVSLAYGA